jgi:hypothetical protein
VRISRCATYAEDTPEAAPDAAEEAADRLLCVRVQLEFAREQEDTRIAYTEDAAPWVPEAMLEEAMLDDAAVD